MIGEAGKHHHFMLKSWKMAGKPLQNSLILAGFFSVGEWQPCGKSSTKPVTAPKNYLAKTSKPTISKPLQPTSSKTICSKSVNACIQSPFRWPWLGSKNSSSTCYANAMLNCLYPFPELWDFSSQVQFHQVLKVKFIAMNTNPRDPLKATPTQLFVYSSIFISLCFPPSQRKMLDNSKLVRAHAFQIYFNLVLHVFGKNCEFPWLGEKLCWFCRTGVAKSVKSYRKLPKLKWSYLA